MAMSNIGRGGQAAATALLLIALAGCGSTPEAPPPVPAPSTPPPVSAPATTMTVPDREPHTLVLNATGSGKVTSIKYTLDGRVVQQGAVTLPWREPVTVPADGLPHSWTLEVEFTGNGGVDLVAIFDGQVVAQGGSAGGGSGSTSGSAGVGGTVNG
ncbi:hypothetical protein MOQ72_26035 [Saccharopolyspora sp. K220]|uniref:hypothetical protein n=1 Tax=Saccharopolyspora soli TaxID=2926618 RepID=UPI001F59F0BF|nr:hypothetical protein [Saccharopolyspora soli]MCI2420908.1 hypothetical protein [Saccharopolyspora soli]